MDMKKLKKEIRENVIEFVNQITRQEEEANQGANVKLSDKGEKIKKCLTETGYVVLGPAFSELLGEKIVFDNQGRIYRKWMMLHSTLKDGLTGLLYAQGSNNYYDKEGVVKSSFNTDPKTSLYATKEQIVEFFDYTPDDLIMNVFKEIPAEK